MRRATRTVAVVAAAGTALAAGAIGLHARADTGAGASGNGSSAAPQTVVPAQSQDQFQGFVGLRIEPTVAGVRSSRRALGWLVTPTTNTDWYVLRSSGLVALVLLTAVMVLGIATSGGVRMPGQPRFVTGALHRSISLLSVVFVALHIGTTLLDHYAGVSLAASFIPFAPATNAFWVGIGVVSSDLVLALVATSLVRRRLGYSSWRVVHWLAYLSWPTAFAHGVGMGSDAATWWFQGLAFACLAAVVVATAARVLTHRPGKRLRRPAPV